MQSFPTFLRKTNVALIYNLYPSSTTAVSISLFTRSLRATEYSTMAAITEASVKTAPFDPRYPNTNQTRYCYQSYLDFHRCQKVRGDQYEPCQYFKKVFTSMCPNAWVEKWNDQIEAGTFAGRI